jgi:hypothetical protein
MESLKKMFGITTSIRPGIGDRVKNKDTRELGTVTGKSVIKGSVKVPALNVQYDNGQVAMHVAENEFIKVDKNTLPQVRPKVPDERATRPVQTCEGPKGKGYSHEFEPSTTREL